MRWERGSILTAPPFGYSPELPLRRPGGPKTRPAISGSPPPSGLPKGIANSLRRLRGLHLRLSLCRVTLAPGCDSRLSGIDDRSLIAEMADDGALIVIFIHPQGITDEEAAGGLCARLEQSLRPCGIPLGALRVAILPCDAAAIDDSDATLQLVMDLPSRALLGAAGLVSAAAS
ncbi:hypothetical protein [Pelagibius marinus]|uniref:hypothetical protein n=1 Tax=Pelagibius marinus TaxID=2762760 RepID=UPI0018727950|nr:hypothetical protein [Pelagibius marinus]